MQPKQPSKDAESFQKVTAIAELEGKIQELGKSLAEMKNNYLRAVADLENYKKRAIRDREEVVQQRTESLLSELLEVKDHLEMALEHTVAVEEVKALHEGVVLTLKQLQQFLEKFGVIEFESLEKPFDPAFHESVGQEATHQVPPNTVVKIFRKGYLFQGRLLRAARVVISKGS